MLKPTQHIVESPQYWIAGILTITRETANVSLFYSSLQPRSTDEYLSTALLGGACCQRRGEIHGGTWTLHTIARGLDKICLALTRLGREAEADV